MPTLSWNEKFEEGMTRLFALPVYSQNIFDNSFHFTGCYVCGYFDFYKDDRRNGISIEIYFIRRVLYIFFHFIQIHYTCKFKFLSFIHSCINVLIIIIVLPPIR